MLDLVLICIERALYGGVLYIYFQFMGMDLGTPGAFLTLSVKLTIQNCQALPEMTGIALSDTVLWSLTQQLEAISEYDRGNSPVAIAWLQQNSGAWAHTGSLCDCAPHSPKGPHCCRQSPVCLMPWLPAAQFRNAHWTVCRQALCKRPEVQLFAGL